MNVSLTPELEAFVSKQVEGGLYNSASEVVRDALRLLVHQEQERLAKLRALQHEIQAGLDSGPGEAWNLGAFLKEARERG